MHEIFMHEHIGEEGPGLKQQFADRGWQHNMPDDDLIEAFGKSEKGKNGFQDTQPEKDGNVNDDDLFESIRIGKETLKIAA